MMTIERETLQKKADRIGLALAGAVPVGPTPSWSAYRAWINHGYAADMDYLSRPDAVRRREDPRNIMPEARTVLVVAASYVGGSRPAPPPLHGRVSRYAWGEDYHRWLLKQLKELVGILTEKAPDSRRVRTYVDTGPILERAWARRAGLGWIGKNTNLIHPKLGSYLFLGTALLDVPVVGPHPDPVTPSCGSCTRCIDACPTGALVSPGVLDARRCLSYLTIENRGPIPEEFRPALGDRVFGCDICQDVCPWNRKPRQAHERGPLPKHATLSLVDTLMIDAQTFRQRYRHTPIWRATPEGLARNAAVVLGNLGDPAAIPHLVRAAEHHPSERVREHAAWALDQL
jgi:epoxyqueuosine reductase